MNNLITQLKEYFKSTSKEQLDKDYDELKKCNSITFNEYIKSLNMTRKEFNEKYPIYTRDSKSAIFEDREALLSQLLDENIPIYLDSHYYGSPESTDTFSLITKADFDKLKNWRECHYFYLHKNTNNEYAWLMQGGRYD